jgi:hypothetical protein
MAHVSETLGFAGVVKFEKARQYLLPNEDVQLVCQTREGFLVLSSRRFLLLKEDSRSKYNIEKAIPYDCIQGFKQKKADRVEILGIVLDQYGRHTSEIRSFEVKVPRGESGENKSEVRDRFQSAMSRCSSVIEEIRKSDEFTEEIPLAQDYSCLEQLPESLIRNAILDLNTILRDQPVHDELVHEAMKFLGSEPFILEESLRDGNDRENGVLFAAGKQGYYWILGKKRGRFMSNVIVDTVEWDNIRCFTYQWQSHEAIIDATYTPTRDGRESTMQYQWKPIVNDDTLHYPWLLQQLNGPWILADVMYKCSGKPLPASWVTRAPLKDLKLHKQRYYH